MKYQKIINLLDNTPIQSTNIRTKNWVKIDDDSRRGYNTNSKIKFQTSMFRSGLCYYSDSGILVNGTNNYRNSRFWFNQTIR